MGDDQHSEYCSIWTSTMCSCGLSAKRKKDREDDQQRQRDHRAHGVRPLGMTDAEFLLTMKIKPEES